MSVAILLLVRHILAAVHFNHNLHRETRKHQSDGKDRIKVSYPKFKNGEATVRNQPVAQNFGEIFKSKFSHSFYHSSQLIINILAED